MRRGSQTLCAVQQQLTREMLSPLLVLPWGVSYWESSCSWLVQTLALTLQLPLQTGTGFVE